MNRTARFSPERPGPLKYHFVRLGLRFFAGAYLRVRVEGREHLPDEPYLICFNHPSWVDPVLLAAFWPDRRWLFIFGPREQDMAVGRRNRVIRWSRRGVPFRPTKDDLLDTTRRAMTVFRDGHVLAVAGEGRLSHEDGSLIPLQDGPAFLALRSQVPIVPLAIVGTRWLWWGKRVRLRIGRPLATRGRRADRRAVASLTAATQAAIKDLLQDVEPDRPPGRFGRWLSEAFNERPWLTEQGNRGADGT